MKAVLYKKYGKPNVLDLIDVPKPKPSDNEILVKIHATSVTSGDIRLRSSDFPTLFWLPARLIFGLFSPKKKILGHEFSGIVEQVGSEINTFKKGDKVFGTTTMLKAGSYAEYICVPEKWKSGVIERMPENLDFDETAVLPIGAMTAMFLLKKAEIKNEDRILVYGSSGSVGSYAVQLAKNYGADVTAVCSKANFDMMESLGISNLIDYKTQNYTSINQKYDIVFDAVGKTTKSQAKKILNAKGKFVSVNTMTNETQENINEIKKLAEAKKLVPFIDRKFDLSEIVQAHKYVDSGRKRGNVVIQIVT